MEGGKTFREYILGYQLRAKNDQIHQVVTKLGVNEKILRNIMAVNASANNINEFGRFDNLKDTVDFERAREYFEEIDNSKVPPFKVKIRVHNLLQEFILKGGFDL